MVRMTPQQLEQLDLWRFRYNLGRAAAVRQLVDAALEHVEWEDDIEPDADD